MNEHERILEIIRTKNKTSTDLDPSRTALIVVDMFVEFGRGRRR